MGTLYFKVVRHRHGLPSPDNESIEKPSAVELLKLSPGVNPAASAKVTLPAEFLNLCSVIMPGAAKAYNKNQEPSETLEETTAALYELAQQRVAKKHKNYLRRQRAKQAKAIKKEQQEETASVSSGSEKSAVEPLPKTKMVSQVTVQTEKKNTESVACRSNSPHKRDEVLYEITPSKIMPKNAAAQNGSSSPRVYKNSRLGLRRNRIGSRS